jgi:hypothetical protein
MKDANLNPAVGDFQRGYQFDAKFGTADFTTKPPDLELYLMRAGEADVRKFEWASTSTNSEVEHFFYQIPVGDKDQKYELWVANRETTFDVPNYAIAWWGEDAKKGDGNGRRIGGSAWAEEGIANGNREDAEAGVPLVDVTLKDLAGNVVDVTQTDYLGRYAFDDISAGDYRVEFSLPRGFSAFTLPNPDGEPTDSDVVESDSFRGRTGIVTVGSEDVEDIDAALIPIPGGEVRGTAWRDTNANDTRDEGEAGIAGIPVYLRTDAGVAVATTFTDEDGRYRFGRVPEGSYQITFEGLEGHLAVTPAVGPPESDSDVDPMTLTTPVFAVSAGSLVDRDIGYERIPVGTITGLVWQDVNGDGLRHVNERVRAGVPVKLLLPGTDTVIADTLTDAYGVYEFTSVAPGLYDVYIDGGGQVTVRDADPDDLLDSDFDPLTRLAAGVLVEPWQVLALDAGLLDHLPVVLVYKATGVGSLTLTSAQVLAVINGTITNWQELGGPDLPIIRVLPVGPSPAARALSQRFTEPVGGFQIADTAGYVTLTPDGDDVQISGGESAVAAYVESTPGAVAFMSWWSADAADLPMVVNAETLSAVWTA